MTHEDVVSILIGDFGAGNFAQVNSSVIVTQGGVDKLYDIAMEKYRNTLGKSEYNKLLFRSAYILESVYFDYPNEFKPFIIKFFTDFSNSKNQSAHRHFTKIMSHLLNHSKPPKELSDQIARACVEWITEQGVRVAVQIWAMEVLIQLYAEVWWLQMSLYDLLEILRANPSPAMQVRLRQWKLKLQM